MSIISGIRDFIATCPHITTFATSLGCNYLGEKTASYSINEEPVNPLIRKYMDGSSDRRVNFTFTSREYYGNDQLVNLQNSGFYQDFSDWIESKNDAGQFPSIGTGKEPYDLSVITSAYIYNNDKTNAVYQIQLQLLYHQSVETPTNDEEDDIEETTIDDTSNTEE